MSADLFEAFGGSAATPATGSPTKLDKHKTTARPPAATVLRSPQRPETSAEPLWRSVQGGNDVLFDAGDEGTQDGIDDDFGDFEDASRPSPAEWPSVMTRPSKGMRNPARTEASIDLLGLDEGQVQGQRADIDAIDTGTMLAAPLKNTSSNAFVDDSWGDFERPTETLATDTRHSAGDRAHHNAQTVRGSETFGTDWDAFEHGPAHTSGLHATEGRRQHTVVSSKALASPAARKTDTPVQEEPEEDVWDDFEDQPGAITSEQRSATFSTSSMLAKIYSTLGPQQPLLPLSFNCIVCQGALSPVELNVGAEILCCPNLCESQTCP
ncbi:uncharacterized protein AB675_8537 [Cyphellophora attinorum]|uniref:Uncharacterized protein n=1 Tax=Cyphellophora attinorum TaxID=1664694 RepID=A0A0N1HWH3_9EURO|nr:uncharacterized protein AB675_8537 [Phialophora attinorum]KPI44543.1 hypothetical protein AB675_8537 [Phialophora attinorum]